MLVLKKNAIRILFNIITQPKRQIIPNYIESKLIENIVQTIVLKYLIVYHICVFYIIFPYYDLICGNCYFCNFNIINNNQFDS